MKMFDQLNIIFPYLISIRKLETYLSFDIEFVDSWRLPKKYVDEKMLLEQPTENHGMRRFSFAVEFEEDNLNGLLTNLNGIVKYNLEREEKEKLFEQKVKELKMFFDSSKLEDLKELEFKLKQEFKLELEDEKGDNVEVVTRRTKKG